MYAIDLDNSLERREALSLKNLAQNAPVNERGGAGYSIADVRKALRIVDAIDAAVAADADHPSLLLEREEWAFLKDRIEKHQWVIAHPAVIELVDKVVNATEAKVEKVKDPKAES